jgi:hypothetical protein
MKVNGACLLRKQGAVNPLWPNDGFDCSSSHCQRWPKRCKGCGVHLRKRLDAITRRHNQVARDLASAARFYDEMLIGQNWRRSSRQSGALCEVPHFVRDDTIMLAGLFGMFRQVLPFCLAGRCRFFSGTVGWIVCGRGIFRSRR